MAIKLNLDLSSASFAKKRRHDELVANTQTQSTILSSLRPAPPTPERLAKKRKTISRMNGWKDKNQTYYQQPSASACCAKVARLTGFDEIHPYWNEIVSVLGCLTDTPAKPTRRELLPYPGHCEIVPSYVEAIPKALTIQDACDSLANDKTGDLRILCQRLSHLSDLIHTADILNLAIIDAAVRFTLVKILDSMSKTKWPGVDIRAVTFFMRHVLHSAASFGDILAWDGILEDEIKHHPDFIAVEETRCWSKFGQAMNRGDTGPGLRLWNHYSLVGMLSGEDRGWNIGFVPCMGHGWVVADFDKHRLTFLRADSVTISIGERFGTFAMVFHTPGSGPEDSQSYPPVVFPEVSSRQLLKRSKFSLEEWYETKRSKQLQE